MKKWNTIVKSLNRLKKADTYVLTQSICFFINDLSRLNWRSLFNKKPPAMRVGNIGYTEITFPVS